MDPVSRTLSNLTALEFSPTLTLFVCDSRNSTRSQTRTSPSGSSRMANLSAPSFPISVTTVRICSAVLVRYAICLTADFRRYGPRAGYGFGRRICPGKHIAEVSSSPRSVQLMDFRSADRTSEIPARSAPSLSSSPASCGPSRSSLRSTRKRARKNPPRSTPFPKGSRVTRSRSRAGSNREGTGSARWSSSSGGKWERRREVASSQSIKWSNFPRGSLVSSCMYPTGLCSPFYIVAFFAFPKGCKQLGTKYVLLPLARLSSVSQSRWEQSSERTRLRGQNCELQGRYRYWHQARASGNRQGPETREWGETSSTPGVDKVWKYRSAMPGVKKEKVLLGKMRGRRLDRATSA
jgi:hypothetical protein